jgi:glycosyltransferase involved in cell wall biosynthesis
VLQNRPDVEVHVRPMGVHCEGFSPHWRRDSLRESLLHRISVKAAPAPAQRLLLYVGRLSPEKTLEILPTMMASLAVDASAQYHLLLAGDGRRAAWFREIADRTALGRIHLLGHVADREYLADLYPNCDALVHPNAREPFGITPLEAMASGLPVVAPRAGGVLSYADDGNAWPVKPAGEDFAAGVRAAFANEAARSAKVERAIRTAAKLDWSHVAASFFDLYDGL